MDTCVGDNPSNIFISFYNSEAPVAETCLAGGKKTIKVNCKIMFSRGEEDIYGTYVKCNRFNDKSTEMASPRFHPEINIIMHASGTSLEQKRQTKFGPRESNVFGNRL